MASAIALISAQSAPCLALVGQKQSHILKRPLLVSAQPFAARPAAHSNWTRAISVLEKPPWIQPVRQPGVCEEQSTAGSLIICYERPATPAHPV
jgi:hypothetical protein